MKTINDIDLEIRKLQNEKEMILLKNKEQNSLEFFNIIKNGDVLEDSLYSLSEQNNITCLYFDIWWKDDNKIGMNAFNSGDYSLTKIGYGDDGYHRWRLARIDNQSLSIDEILSLVPDYKELLHDEITKLEKDIEEDIKNIMSQVNSLKDIYSKL
jgi:hypothetical protein